MFTSEEPTRFGLSCSGSRAMAGVMSAAALESKLDAQGLHFIQARACACACAHTYTHARAHSCMYARVWWLEGGGEGEKHG